MNKQVYLVPDVPTPLDLEEVVVEGTLIKRLYDAAFTEAAVIIIPVKDTEMLFLLQNRDMFGPLSFTVLTGIPGVKYSLTFMSQAYSAEQRTYDDLRQAIDTSRRTKPAAGDNSDRFRDLLVKKLADREAVELATRGEETEQKDDDL